MYMKGKWKKLYVSASHNELSGLQGGTTDEYYHLTSAQHAGLTGLSDGYVPFVSGTAFADSPIQVDGDSVGVGVTPLTKLHVYGSPDSDIVSIADGGLRWRFGTNTAHNLFLDPASSSRQSFTIKNTGSGETNLIIDDGNTFIGTAVSPTGTATKTLIFGDNAGDPTPGTNTAAFYAKDVAGTVETFAADEAGNVTQLSDHASEWPEELEVSETYPQVKTDENKFLGIKRYIALGRMAELVEELSHKARLLPADKKLVVYEATGEKLDWDSVQAEHVQNREKEIQAAEKSKAEIEEQITEVDVGLSILAKQFSELKSTGPVNVPGGDAILTEQIAKLKQKIVEAEKTKEDLERQLEEYVIPEPLAVKPMPKWIADRLGTESSK